MRKLCRFVLLIIFGCVFTSCDKASAIDTTNAFPLGFGDGNKYGYINREGIVIVKPKFSVCHRFSDGYAIVRDLNGNYQILDKNSRIINVGKKSDIGDFHEGFARVNTKDKSGYIDTQGKYIIQILKAKLSDFSEGFAVINDQNVDRFYFINTKGVNAFDKYFEEASSFSEGYASVKQNGKYCYIDASGQIILQVDFSFAGSFHNGFAAVANTVNNNQLYGFIDKSGKLQISLQFSNYDEFHENYAAVTINDKSGIINKKGEWIIPPKYQDMYSPRENVVVFQQDNKWGFMLVDGTILHEPAFDVINHSDLFKGGMGEFANYVIRNGINYLSSGYLRKDGKIFWGKDYSY